MEELLSIVPSLKTSQELEQAIKNYRSSDMRGDDLYQLWLAIREASLNQLNFQHLAGDRIPGSDSY